MEIGGWVKWNTSEDNNKTHLAYLKQLVCMQPMEAICISFLP